MRRSIYLMMLSACVALCSLALGLSPAFASTRQATVARSHFTARVSTGRAHFRPTGWQSLQEHNQFFRGTTYSHIHLTFQGHDQNNSGNQGYNRGFNQNFGNNGGNLIANHGRASRYQRTNQIFYGTSYSNGGLDAIGYSQNNTGNQGLNDGYNEDHGGNAGNQIAN